MVDFKCEKMFPLGKDTAEYRLLTKDYVKVRELEGNEVLFVEPQALVELSQAAFRSIFTLPFFVLDFGSFLICLFLSLFPKRHRPDFLWYYRG